MAFLPRDQIEAIGFQAVGRNILLSDRAAIYRPERMVLGDNVKIEDFSVLSGRIVIGRNVHISVFCHVAGGSEGIVFEDFAGLAPNCHVFTESDDYLGEALTNPTVPHEYRKETLAPVRLGRHCIVGTGSTIMPGVDLADGCSVGAMSMVARSTEPWGVYVGVPARRVRERSRALLELEAKYLGTSPADPSS